MMVSVSTWTPGIKTQSGPRINVFLFRCDQKENCKDGSDEKNCRIVHVDKSKYLKDKQPPAVDDEGMVKVDVDVDITRILVIDEERNIFSRNQFYENFSFVGEWNI